jgi:hypothetical protein
MAVNCCVVLAGMLGFAGVTSIDTSVRAVTVKVVDRDMDPDVAVIVVVPVDNEVTRPVNPAALLKVATAGVDEFQITDTVRS